MTTAPKPHLEQGVLFELFTDPVQRQTPENQHLHLMALAQVPGVGPASLRAMYDAFPILGDVWFTDNEVLEQALRGGRISSAEKLTKLILGRREQSITEAANKLQALAERDIRILLDTDHLFPERLRSIPSAPRWLFVQGNTRLLSRESSVAVVGTREASPRGMELTKHLCELLVRWGYVVVSGLAEGIDTVAHRTTVDLRGDTVAVLGTGINIEFPAGSAMLRERILERGGMVLTEYFPDAMYSRQSFVQRNRIQAGLANAVIPVESMMKSGTAHTVRFAEEFGRQLVGVWNTRFGLTARSEIFLLLMSKGYPTYDLASEEEREKLRQLLSDFGQDAVPRDIDDRLLWRSAYGPALRNLKAAVSARPPELEAIEWVKETVQRILDDLENSNGDKGGLFRP
jgi:DNA processing protein